MSFAFFFFFQAEDGIRDWSVTGVQTCALPISEAREKLLSSLISNFNGQEVEPDLNDAPRDKGTIIAPCPNHNTCPMYLTSGVSRARKDYCSFQDRKSVV